MRVARVCRRACVDVTVVEGRARRVRRHSHTPSFTTSRDDRRPGAYDYDDECIVRPSTTRKGGRGTSVVVGRLSVGRALSQHSP